MTRCNVVVVLCLWLAALAPARASDTHVERHLPGPPVSNLSRPGEDFRLATVQARDAQGQPIPDVPAQRIDLRSDLDGWEQQGDTLPPIHFDVPAAQRPSLSLFYASPVGWMLVPRDWKLVRAVQGIDGGAVFSFTAARGPVEGWLSVVSIPACVGCMYQEADGLFSGAHDKLDKLLGQSTPAPILAPNPDKIDHPSACMVEFGYRLPASPAVRTVAFFADDAYDPQFRQLTLAAPKTQAKVVAAILGAYRQVLPTCKDMSSP